MTPSKVLLTDGLAQEGTELLRTRADVDDRAGISADELAAVIEGYDALVVRSRTKVTAKLLESARRLKVIGRAGVGVDNIDLDAAKAHHIVVVNAPRATSVAVAELTMGLMLSLVREIPRADSAMKSGQWLKKELEGSELAGKTLGILGFGRIGTEVAKRALAFDMQIIASDPRKSDVAPHLPVERVSLDELLARSDLLTIHTPLNAETRGLFNSSTLEKMKPGAYLLCAARGGIIVEEDLLHALESGHLAGAALDVYAQEPPENNPLILHPKVICTPHIGAQTHEAQRRSAQDIAEEVLAALEGKELRWRVA